MRLGSVWWLQLGKEHDLMSIHLLVLLHTQARACGWPTAWATWRPCTSQSAR